MYLPIISSRSWHPPPYLSLNFPLRISVLPCSTTQILSLDHCMTYLGLPCFVTVRPCCTIQIFISGCWCNFSWICPLTC
jgi:hypothetical protein